MNRNHRLKRALSILKRRWFLIGMLGVILFAQTTPPVKADSFFGAARPYYFSIAGWGVQNALKKTQHQLFAMGPVAAASSTDRLDTVREYFRLSARATEIRRQLEVYQIQGPSSGVTDVTLLKQELAQTDEKRASTRDHVEMVIEQQIAEVVRREAIDLQWPFPRFSIFFPPVDFKLTPLPKVLIISPRDRIQIKDSMLIKAPQTAEEMDQIEGKQEKLGYSALVDNIGGVATYPAMVTDSANLEFTVMTAAHEWTHHYLFFRPLGRTYGSDYTMLTLNESAADVIGGEIADAVLKEYGIVRQKAGARKAAPQESGFNFNKEMRQIRLTVDDYLAKGEIEKAESYMEERRQFLASHGYLIRKLNQAYFAFHGSYSASPSSSSPIAGQLKEVRQKYATLGVFSRAISGVSSYEEFKSLLY
ncbi:MAG: hypothetical protein HYY29_02030 [Chloroflexi bacterium]|nr:hypothetical protein [Chloroflexota bacterium]